MVGPVFSICVPGSTAVPVGQQKVSSQKGFWSWWLCEWRYQYHCLPCRQDPGTRFAPLLKATIPLTTSDRDPSRHGEHLGPGVYLGLAGVKTNLPRRVLPLHRHLPHPPTSPPYRQTAYHRHILQLYAPPPPLTATVTIRARGGRGCRPYHHIAKKKMRPQSRIMQERYCPGNPSGQGMAAGTACFVTTQPAPEPIQAARRSSAPR